MSDDCTHNCKKTPWREEPSTVHSFGSSFLFCWRACPALIQNHIPLQVMWQNLILLFSSHHQIKSRTLRSTCQPHSSHVVSLLTSLLHEASWECGHETTAQMGITLGMGQCSKGICKLKSHSEKADSTPSAKTILNTWLSRHSLKVILKK